MDKKLRLFCLAVLGSALLCLALSGCGSANKDSGEEPSNDEGVTATEGASSPQAAVKKAKPAPPPPRQATIPAGTPLNIVTSAMLSTKTNKSGDAFSASLSDDIVSDGWIVAKRGALVTGVVADSDPGGRVKGVASITLKLDKLELADGRQVSITTNAFNAEAGTSKKKDAAKIGVGAGIGAAVGAIAGGGKGAAIGAGIGGATGTAAALATRGDPAEVPSETNITFELTEPLTVVEQR